MVRVDERVRARVISKNYGDPPCSQVLKKK
jgi:hypothetical protein